MKSLPNPRPNTGAAPTLEWIKSNCRIDQGCWAWLGSVDQNGYGRINSPGYRRVHRLSYELAIGQIPDGLVLDHKCRNPSCCNPDHLEPVTNQENVRRGKSLRYVDGKCPSHPHAKLYKARWGHRCSECLREYESAPERAAKRSAYEKARQHRPERIAQRREASRRYMEKKRRSKPPEQAALFDGGDE